jgi:pyruvate-formate lyase-activating enzyme
MELRTVLTVAVLLMKVRIPFQELQPRSLKTLTDEQLAPVCSKMGCNWRCRTCFNNNPQQTPHTHTHTSKQEEEIIHLLGNYASQFRLIITHSVGVACVCVVVVEQQSVC